jgi:hypothetical protein
VLRASQRVADGRDITIASADEVGALPALIAAPSDPVKLGAANRALERLGIPWRFGARRRGEQTLRGSVASQTVTDWYELVAQSGAVAETLAVIGREPWIVAGPRYVLVGSPLIPEATSFPVRAAFVPWLATVLTERLVGEPGTVIGATPGASLPRPSWADALEAGDGMRTALTDVVEAPARAGTYYFTRGPRRVGALVVNPTADESVLDRYTVDDLAARLRAERTLTAQTPSAWSSMAFHVAARRSLLEPALLLALALLTVEAVVIGVRPRRAA